MAHYADQTMAKLGDRVRGLVTPPGRVIEGLIVSITRGPVTCNAQVAYPAIVQPSGVTDELPVVMMQCGWATIVELELLEPSPITPHAVALPTRGA